MTDTQDANQQFDELWETIGKGRLTVGDEDKGVEIVLDVDLSPTGILKQLREIARSGHDHGLIGDDDHKDMESSTEELEKLLDRVIPGKLHDKFKPLIGR